VGLKAFSELVVDEVTAGRTVQAPFAMWIARSVSGKGLRYAQVQCGDGRLGFYLRRAYVNGPALR